MKRRLESRTPRPEQAPRPLDGPQERFYFTAAHAAVYLDFPTVNAFRMWVRRHSVPSLRRGRTLLYARPDLERAIGAAHRRLRSA